MINNINLILVLIMTISGALGGVFFKKSTPKKRIFLLLGLSFYGLGALINIYLLKELPYTIVFLSNALTYIWALVFAYFIFKERIGKLKILGVALIASGIVILVY